jgi:hypothetical protein
MRSDWAAVSRLGDFEIFKAFPREWAVLSLVESTLLAAD